MFVAEHAGFVISELGIEHLGAVARLQRGVMPHPWSERQFATSVESGHRCLIAHTPGGEPVAVAVASRVGPEAELLTLATAGHYQRRGVARSLLAVSLHSLAEAGAEVCFLEVMEGNAPALALYQAFGFAQVGRRRGYYVLAGGAVDALVMRTSLQHNKDG